MELGDGPPLAPGAAVQNLTPQALAQASGLRLLPFLVQQTLPATPADLMARDWPLPEAGIDKHRGYAFQWYALAALALLSGMALVARAAPSCLCVLVTIVSFEFL